MSTSLNEITAAFQSVGVATRLELLLDFSKQLPPLDERHVAERAAGLQRVPECMSPVFVWVESPDPALNHLRIILDVAEEAPTIKGILAIIHQAFDGEPAESIAKMPLDLVQRLGLDSVIRMNRMTGIQALIIRLRNAAGAFVDAMQGNH